MTHWVNTHGIEALVIAWIFSAFVSGMPARPDAGWIYQWLFSSLHIASANLARVIATQMPNSAIGKQLVGQNGAEQK